VPFDEIREQRPGAGVGWIGDSSDAWAFDELTRKKHDDDI
jgi:hypothetical protein